MAKLIISFRVDSSLKELILEETKILGITLSEWLELKISSILYNKEDFKFDFAVKEKKLINQIEVLLNEIIEQQEKISDKKQDILIKNKIDEISEQIYFYNNKIN
jgi:antitoxin component of RelBE/YafQ-DinJ toxin-antitoxin module